MIFISLNVIKYNSSNYGVSSLRPTKTAMKNFNILPEPLHVVFT